MASTAERRWVEIGFTVLQPEQRTGRLPEDTKRVPYYARVRGFLDGEAKLGDTVSVETLLGRSIEGELLRFDPAYGHGFGHPVKELIEAGCEARALLRSLKEEL